MSQLSYDDWEEQHDVELDGLTDSAHKTLAGAAGLSFNGPMTQWLWEEIIAVMPFSVAGISCLTWADTAEFEDSHKANLCIAGTELIRGHVS